MPKGVDENTRKEIIRLFFDGNSLRMIAKEVGLAGATVQGIVKHFRRTGWIRSDKSSGRRRLKSTQEIVEFMECCLLQKPSLTAKEIRMSLLRENICVQENLPSVRMVHHIMKSDLNYSFKKISQTPTEQVTERNMERILQYIDTVSQLDPQTLHFFDETGVKRTTPNRNHDYGHSLRGQKAVEFQRYAYDVNFTVSLLHNARGVSNFNILDSPSNGLEMLNFFEETMELFDENGQHVLSPGDTVIMDNCGFHHGRITEPALREMLATKNVTLLFQPPYSPEFNSCEMCFSQVKRKLRENYMFAVLFTETAIIDGLASITPLMSRNFFRFCGIAIV
ncbi:uncharacterized protein LOC102800893 [Saccoglossus kowalevskii]|uniref:Uncharacterized protein LOC102800893 n=1 Tax=Saccoglossus kowalevskii TaxID=10224 RepID=A0ABM0LUJ3_SACKO|nr:PREDICTED: uncharacterized protein LOC102800893 [Saccoglossus kowalevskii]